MNCPKCRTANPDGARICSFCGEPLVPVQDASQPNSSGQQTVPPAPYGMARPAMRSAPVAAQTSGMAIAALVMGLLTLFCGITAIPAIIVGFIALSQIKNSDGRLTGQGMAIAGIVVPVAAIFLIAVIAAAMFPVFAKSRNKARDTTCMNNQRQIAVAVQMYIQDNNEMFPPKGADWTTVLNNYGMSDSIVRCPYADGTATIARPDYGFNSNLFGKALGNINNPQGIAMLADTESSGGLLTSESDIDWTRHSNRTVAAFIDGHVSIMPTGTSISLQ